jgi:FkbM family methyltransferase
VIYEGYIWPDGDTAHKVIVREAPGAVARFLEHVPERGCVLQAGGNVGLYPNLLREHFDRVVTAEPDPGNWRCLMINLGDVEAHQVAFGVGAGRCSMEKAEPANCGALRVGDGKDVPIVSIDSLGLKPDAIWLDIEGYEYFALCGARQTLMSCAPVVVIEEKGLGSHWSLKNEHCSDLLQSMGYSRVDRIGRDSVYKVSQ